RTGALLRGHVVAIDTRPALNIKLRFDDVETAWGRVSIRATVRNAEPYASTLPGTDRANAPYDAALYLPLSGPIALSEAAAVGGGPIAESDRDAIFLPVGAELRLMLTKTLVAPPARRMAR